ncbi:hypothetical protein [Phaffia rhodozyma]|uniref:Uncharacterized protein n=1 Tax=Phaffia rhodozyma TaxID=264483 RepID=A0A0F7SHQ5_PHARH|nr:hypothetical protein [Phaffia rhodozyma]
MSTTFLFLSLLQAVTIASAKPINRRQDDVSTAWNETSSWNETTVWDPTSIENATVSVSPTTSEPASVPSESATTDLPDSSLFSNKTSTSATFPLSATNETVALPDVVSVHGNSSALGNSSTPEVTWNGTSVSYDNTTVVEFGNYTFTPQNITLLSPDMTVNITQPFYLENATISSANGATQTLLINGTVVTFNNVTGTLVIPLAIDVPDSETNSTVPTNSTTTTWDEPSASATPVWTEPSAFTTSAWAEPSATVVASEPSVTTEYSEVSATVEASAPSASATAVATAEPTPSASSSEAESESTTAESESTSETEQSASESTSGSGTDETDEPAATVTLYVTETEAETQTQTQTQTETIYQTATQTATQTTSVFITETAALPTMTLGLIPVEQSNGPFAYSISRSSVSTSSSVDIAPTPTAYVSTVTGTATGKDTIPPTLTDLSVIASLLPTSIPAFTYTLPGVNDTITIGAPLSSAFASASAAPSASASALPDWTSAANGTLAKNESSVVSTVSGGKNVTVGIVIPAGSNWTEPAESYASDAALLNIPLASMVGSARTSTETAAATSSDAVTRRSHRTSPWARVRRFRN